MDSKSESTDACELDAWQNKKKTNKIKHKNAHHRAVSASNAWNICLWTLTYNQSTDFNQRMSENFTIIADITAFRN